MIYITEKKTSKVPGITSVFVDFKYDPAIVEEIKSIPCKNFSKRTNLWEIPITYLSELIDKLCVYDDIKLKLCNITFEDDIAYKLQTYKTKPFDYQIEGIQYGLNHDTWLLLDPPGLGKTLQLIYLAEELKKRDKLKHCLIICGINTLKTNWQKEILKHSKLDCKILGERTKKNGKKYIGSVQERLKDLKGGCKEFFLITNIETLRNNDIVKAINNPKNGINCIFCDEIHVCKNNSSQQGKNLLKLNKAQYRVGATGTLLMNKPLDAFVPLSWIDADRSTQGNYEHYYCVYGGDFNHEFLGYRNLSTLQKQLELYTLRRPKSLLGLPDKVIVEEYVDMSTVQKAFYEDIKNGVITSVDKVKLKPAMVMSMAMRLRQATACPSILTTLPIPSAKLDRTEDLVEQITSEGNKVVIFSTFKETVYELQQRLSQYKPLIGTGDIDDNVISANVDQFQSNPENKVFIGTWQKCGTGITLTAANYMIFIDTPWTDAAFTQNCDRIYRIGTDKKVTIYNLITTDTVDEQVLQIVTDKGAISDYVLDGTITEKGFASLQKYIEELRQ